MEEYESGTKPMEGVGTSTAGFIGAAERGPVEGTPGLVTNFTVVICRLMNMVIIGFWLMRWNISLSMEGPGHSLPGWRPKTRSAQKACCRMKRLRCL